MSRLEENLIATNKVRELQRKRGETGKTNINLKPLRQCSTLLKDKRKSHKVGATLVARKT